MELNELAFLAAFLLPVAVLGAINLLLALSGESGTLLLPSLRGYPKVELEGAAAPAAEPVPARTSDAEGANGEVELRKAA
jgi:hypothetical protein